MSMAVSDMELSPKVIQFMETSFEVFLPQKLPFKCVFLSLCQTCVSTVVCHNFFDDEKISKF